VSCGVTTATIPTKRGPQEWRITTGPRRNNDVAGQGLDQPGVGVAGPGVERHAGAREGGPERVGRGLLLHRVVVDDRRGSGHHLLLQHEGLLLLLRHGGHLHAVGRREPARRVERDVHRRRHRLHHGRHAGRSLPGVVARGLARSPVRVVV
jgi:hypothetical protein